MTLNLVLRRSLLLSLVLFVLASCGNGNESGGSTPESTAHNAADVSDNSKSGDVDATTFSGDLTIFAAASLTDAFEEMRGELESEHPDLSLTFNFAGSSTLRTQLEEGAEADVFASANYEQMQSAQEAGRIAGDPVTFARNRLVLIVPADNPAGIESPADLAEPGILLILAQEQVPAGDYARRMFEAMSQSSEYGEDFNERVLENLVSDEQNVRAVATKVQLGEADAGIVYASDVTSDLRDAVQVIDIPDQFNVLAEYPVAIVEDSPDTSAAQMFIDYLLSADGQAILKRHGFITIE